MTELNDIGEQVGKILTEEDPQKCIALSRRLRCDLWYRLDREDRKKLCDLGVDLSILQGGLREA
ncbi:hypothetical protein N4R57_00065 [Rhodobacteraceae bacterium D3-12]|nr:hypothetical protein N4R57_00065 [Rhodobacteraceae bacterium D3-12]